MTCGTIALVIISCVAQQSLADGFLRGKASVADVETSLMLELRDLVAAKNRPAEMEADLKQMFNVLPKNSQGNLGHEAVRYALHRFFQRRHGWFIKGLEPGTQKDALSVMKEWVPAYLQDLMEKYVQEKGVNLRELAVLAATLEDLVRQETASRLGEVYTTMGFPVDTSVLSAKHVEDIMHIYLMNFVSNWTNFGEDPDDAQRLFLEFQQAYEDWNITAAWLDKILSPHLHNAVIDRMTTQSMAGEIGEKFVELNDLECGSLKTTMLEMEGRKKGRVPLAELYKRSTYSHWNFSEKIDYLRILGALDESEVNQPQVIISNYLMSRPNCLEATDLYAVCCRNECEDLMAQLEAGIGASSAKAGKILALVSKLSSDTVADTGRLPENLVQRLEEVAAANGGQVPLHGRLFAQWMHHVFPRQCPYPHEDGAINPQTPDEWMKETGHESTKASTEEMQALVDACDAWSEEHKKEEDDELPWSVQEKLLAPAATPPAVDTTFAGVAWLLAVSISMFILCRVARKRNLKKSMDRRQENLLLVVVGLNLSILVIGYVADLVNTSLLAFGLMAGCVAFSFARMNQNS